MKQVVKIAFVLLIITHFTLTSAGQFFPRTNGGNGSSASSVPEMDVAIAPIAGALIISLIAAGAERRRRKNKNKD